MRRLKIHKNKSKTNNLSIVHSQVLLYYCAQLWHTTQYRTVLIIFIFLQTIIHWTNWYGFQRICLPECVNKPNKRDSGDICCSVDHYISGCLFRWVSKISLVRKRWNRWRFRHQTWHMCISDQNAGRVRKSVWYESFKWVTLTVSVTLTLAVLPYTLTTLRLVWSRRKRFHTCS